MDLMYPHAIDRLRVAHFILRAWREELGINQQELADNSHRDNGIVSQFMGINYLEDVALGVIDNKTQKPKKLETRDTALRVLIRGLKRSQKDIDALLWLYYGEPFKPVDIDEIGFTLRGVDKPPKIRQANQYKDDVDLRKHVTDLLLDALRTLIPDPIKKSQVQMIFDFPESVHAASQKALFNFDNLPGQRILVTRYPSYMKFPLHIYDYSKWRGSSMQMSDKEKQSHRLIIGKRRELILQHLKEYGERNIHPKRSLINYLQPDFKYSPYSHKQRIEIVEHLIELMDTYEHFYIGLVEEEPEFELIIKNAVGVFLSGAPGETPAQGKGPSIHYGPRYVQWRDKESIFAFFVDFEKNWAAIPEEWRNRTNVAQWLSERVKEAERHKLPQSQ